MAHQAAFLANEDIQEQAKLYIASSFYAMPVGRCAFSTVAIHQGKVIVT
jgi:hypothetical protein